MPTQKPLTFHGKVVSEKSGTSRIVMLSAQAERMFGDCETHILQENGIRTGDTFKIEITFSPHGPQITLSPTPPKDLTPQQLENLHKEFADL